MELTENFSSLWNLNKENGKDYPRIEEVWIDKEVNDIVCEICCIRANFGNYDRIKQWRRNGVKFVTVSFSKMGNFYKQASVHEFGITSAVDSVECRRKVSQGKVSIPITAHNKCYLSKHTEKNNNKKHHVDHGMFSLHHETCARNETAMMQLFSMLHHIIKRWDSHFAWLRQSLLFSIYILGCDSLKSLLKEVKKGIPNHKIDEMITCIYNLSSFEIYTEMIEGLNEDE